MAGGYPLVVNGLQLRTSEAMYQACRFPNNPGIQRRILNVASPLVAKWISRGYGDRFGRKDWNNVKDEIMAWCLRVKLVCNYENFGKILDSTGSKSIVEESRRVSEWGAISVGRSKLKGENKLGRMLMELRREYRKEKKRGRIEVAPPSIPNFRLLGKRIRTLP